MRPVDFAWAVIALPLAGTLLNLAPAIFYAIRTRNANAPAGGSHGAVGAHGEPDTAAGHQAQHVEHDPHDASASPHNAHDDHGGGHGAHGGATPFWAAFLGWIGVLLVAASFALSLAILFEFLGDATLRANGATEHLYTWFTFGPLQYNIDLRVDTLTCIMLVVVTGVSMLVHLFSIGYMAGDVSFSRFFTELALFTVSMLILVLAANFLVIFIGWELVGLSSYLLIGFWFYHAPPPPGSEVPYPPPAQLKAFVTTRLGDFGFLIGILILFVNTSTFDFVQLNSKTLGLDKSIITIAMILVFCGAVGKSAQFPLHVWLPDAMAGPTPVSALIHAATMVAAGVYLVARLFPLYALSAGPQALQVVGYVGAFTALFAATIALTQNDIKGVLAYSTISQLGYMFTGLAVAPTNALGMFHLFTHAFFKALLFLGSGSVIHAVAVQDMRKMGGLAKYMPITALCFLVACLSIAGIPPFSGFWSKDPIIGAAYDSGNYLIYGMTLFTAFLTAFYMFRLYFRTFGGRGGALAGFGGGERLYRGDEPLHGNHDGPWVMWLSLVLLAAATVVIGLFGFVGLNQGFAWFLNGGHNVGYAVAPALDTLTLFGVGAGVLGIALAWSMYGLAVVPANAFTRNPVGAAVYRLLYRRYYLDELYLWLIRGLVLGLSNLAVWIDQHVIDGIADGSAKLVRGIGNITRRSETGALQSYGAALFGGAMIILLIVFFAATGVIGK
jgi:proton-translocating NADH-quinone oxidoreductase chain L